MGLGGGGGSVGTYLLDLNMQSLDSGRYLQLSFSPGYTQG